MRELPSTGEWPTDDYDAGAPLAQVTAGVESGDERQTGQSDHFGSSTGLDYHGQTEGITARHDGSGQVECSGQGSDLTLYDVHGVGNDQQQAEHLTIAAGQSVANDSVAYSETAPHAKGRDIGQGHTGYSRSDQGNISDTQVNDITVCMHDLWDLGSVCPDDNVGQAEVRGDGCSRGTKVMSGPARHGRAGVITNNNRTVGGYLTMRDIDMSVVQGNNRSLKLIFDRVAHTGQHNFRAARIPLPSALNIPQWRSALVGYADAHIVDYLAYGWPIGIDRDAILQSHFRNHTSALEHPGDVAHYIATELGHGALLGPFAGPPVATCHFNPLMTRPKRDSRFRRVIVDLSWPKGYSVNDGISRTQYIDGPMTISLPTPDDMERTIVRVGKGAFLYKTDLSRGYRQLRVDPLDWPYLSFVHESMCYMDICPPFGLRSSAMAMQRVSQAIIHLHSRRGYLSRAYIDDFGGAERHETRAKAALQALQGIMGELGVVQAEAKICLPSQYMVWLGIQFDTIAMSMSIPKAKLAEIMDCLERWRGKLRATRKEMQSILGLLNFVASVAPPARLFTNRMLDDLREAPPAGSTSLSCQFKQDVQFFAELLPRFNGRRIMGKELVPYQHQVELDACLTGCGAVAGDQFYATPFPDHVLRQEHSIAHLEMLNVVVAIKVWRQRWSGWTVQVYCDNLNSVHVLQSGKSRDVYMRSCAREVFLYTAAYDIDVQVCHRPGLQMVWADALSREHTHEKFADRVRNDPHLQTADRLTVAPEFFDIVNSL